MRLKVKRNHPDAKLPTKERNEDAGYDISTIETQVLGAHQTKAFRTGIHLQIEKDKSDFELYVLRLAERSGLGKKGIGVRGGVLDENFCGEVMVLLTNTTRFDYQILKGDRIAQLLIQKVESIPVCEVDELDKTSRNELGLGSSGR